ncbi:hypothetical protein ACFVGN_05675 [Streptomyces sp. NPDC057757]|uniref:hypothetical protein n=1 Tax=Streptomyces sp. NPDC057757 TaxID=3346241 RepID=UPI00369F840C
MADLSMPATAGTTSATRRPVAASLAELHQLCAEDYTSNAARRTQNHRDDAHLIALASEAVAAR